MTEKIIYITPNKQYWIVPVVSEITNKPYYYFLCRKSKEDSVITELFKESENLEELLRWLRWNKIISSDEMKHQIKTLCTSEDKNESEVS